MDIHIPLASPDIQDQDILRVTDVLKSGMLVQGKEVANLENQISGYLGTEFSSMVSNGTASLHLALVSLGIGEGDEVIVPAFSYVATANVVELVGAKCVFVDIDLKTFNIDANGIKTKITDKTKAIIPVHEFGLCADMTKIMEIAKAHNLFVIEDAACAIGAMYRGKYAGTFGDFGSFSFHPRKSITCGEGGCIITNDALLDKKIKTLRNHGIEPDHFPMNFIEAGFNYRMTDFQAALLSSQFVRIEKIIKYKSHLAAIYQNELINPNIRLPIEPEDTRHSWQTFHVLFPTNQKRNEAIDYLKKNGIGSNYGAQCIPFMEYYQKVYPCDAKAVYPNAFEAYTCGLAIPLYEKLNENQIQYISKILNKFN